MKGLLNTYLVFILKLTLALWLFSFFRIAFYLFNSDYFPQPEAINFIGGMRFDWMTITILFLPFLVSLWFYPRSNTKFQGFLFLLSSIVAILSNVLDFEYFKFTQKRTTADLFQTNGLKEDVVNLLPQFAKDYWYLLLLSLLCFVVVVYFYKKINSIATTRLSTKGYLLFILPITVLTFIGFRGGVQLKPLNVIQASQYANPQNISLVLNTSFTLIKSINKEGIVVQEYFAPTQLSTHYTPTQQFKQDSIPKKLNVVIIIAESFSKEYIGFYNNGKGFTPFLDKLMQNSLVFKNAFANGKKSIEALPAILSSIPTLTDRAYISSKYAGNTIESVAKTLKQQGYNSSFYHGGANGTMGFKAFTQIAGIDDYYGREDYPNNDDYDGNWGIFDEPYLTYCVGEFSKKDQPFFSGIFTLSSHHPYTIPKQHQGKLPKGNLPIHESIGYTDLALKNFFDQAKKTDWFENTLFVITADHTQENSVVKYNNHVGRYRVPLIFYAPNHISSKVDSSITQQVDIFPSIIDYLGVEAKMISFGTSVFKEKEKFSVSYINGIYSLIEQQYCLQFNGEQSIGLYNYTNDNELKENLLNDQSSSIVERKQSLETKLKAYIQQYQTRIVTNKLTHE